MSTQRGANARPANCAVTAGRVGSAARHAERHVGYHQAAAESVVVNSNRSWQPSQRWSHPSAHGSIVASFSTAAFATEAGKRCNLSFVLSAVVSLSVFVVLCLSLSVCKLLDSFEATVYEPNSTNLAMIDPNVFIFEMWSWFANSYENLCLCIRRHLACDLMHLAACCCCSHEYWRVVYTVLRFALWTFMVSSEFYE